MEYDANGNFITRQNLCDNSCDNVYTLITDQSGNQIRINHNTAYATQGTDSWRRDEVVAPGPNGNVTYTIDWKLINIGPKTVVSAVDEENNVTTSDIVLSNWEVKYIQLPHPAGLTPGALGNSPQYPAYSYKFGYDSSNVFDDQTPNSYSSGYGMLNYMQMPSGAKYYYSYYTRSDGTGYLVIDEIAFNTYVYCKNLVTADGTSLGWGYNPQGTQTMVLNPDGHYTKYTLGVEGLITKIEQLGQNLALVGPEIQRVWAENRIPWDFSYGIEGVNYYLQQEIVSTRNSSGTLTKSAVTTSSYDGNGNLTEKDEYDWTPYNQNPSTLKRKTTYNYYVSATANSQDYPNAYWNVHNTSIWAAGTSRRLNAVKRQTIFDGSSNPKAATEYVYDSPYNTGNVTSQIQWDNTRLASLPALGSTPTLPTTQSKVTTFAYDSYGNLTDKYESGVQTHITSELLTCSLE